MDGGRPHVVVVGGGIAGLAAAYRLAKLDPTVAVTLVEAEDRLGGKILTERIDGFVIEGGPDSFLAGKPRGVGLCEELGLGDRLQGTMPQGRRAYVWSRGRLHELPEGLTGLVPTRLGPILRTGLLSSRGKVRLALDYVLPPARRAGDEPLAAFVRRRLGREAYVRLVEPLMAGIYAGDGDRLSLAATFPQLRRAEREHGGLIRGVLAAQRGTAAGQTPGGRPAFVTLTAGLGELVDGLASALRAGDARIRTGEAMVGLRLPMPARHERFAVKLGSEEVITADAVVLATPAPATADLVAELDPPLATELRSIPHASSAIVTLAYVRAGVPHRLDAHGYVVPRAERRPVLACTWTSAKWAGRAPEGTALLRVFVGRLGQEGVLAGSDDDLIALARAEIRSTIGVTSTPTLTRVHRWPNGMPQYTLGHLDRLAAMERRLAALPGLFLAGSGYRGVGLPDCIASGEAAAEAAQAYVSGRRAAGSGQSAVGSR